MNIITVLPHEAMMNRVIKDIGDVYLEDPTTKICYISLNKPHTSLIESLKKEDDNLDRYLIIDAITRSVVKEPTGPKNCSFVSSPIAFEELLQQVDNLLNTQQVGALVFDSVCTLFSYSQPDTVMDFLRKLIVRVSVANCESVLVALKPNVRQEILDQVGILADKVLYMDST